MHSFILRSTVLRTGFARRTFTSLASVRPTAVVACNSSAVVEFATKSDVRSLTTIGTSSFVPRRFFASTSADALVDMLNREHTEEVENKSTSMPESLKDLHHLLTTEKGWKIVTDDDTAMTKLYRTVDAMKVQISFHCQDATEQMGEQEEEDGQPPADDEDDAVDDEEPASVRCTVSATKGGKTLFMVCIAQDSMIRIQSTAMAGAVTDIDELHAKGVNPNLYLGPEFTELAEDLQDAFQVYVEDDLGINTDVAAFIAMQFDYKEQCQYVKFLDEAKNLLA